MGSQRKTNIFTIARFPTNGGARFSTVIGRTTRPTGPPGNQPPEVLSKLRVLVESKLHYTIIYYTVLYYTILWQTMTYYDIAIVYSSVSLRPVTAAPDGLDLSPSVLRRPHVQCNKTHLPLCIWELVEYGSSACSVSHQHLVFKYA